MPSLPLGGGAPGGAGMGPGVGVMREEDVDEEAMGANLGGLADLGRALGLDGALFAGEDGEGGADAHAGPESFPEGSQARADWEAMEALMAEDTSPAERAEELRLAGNESFGTGQRAEGGAAFYFREALDKYSQALDILARDVRARKERAEQADPAGAGVGAGTSGGDGGEEQRTRKLVIALKNNRALVSMQLGNWGSALRDAAAVLGLDPDNQKARLRAAKAAFRLEKFDIASEHIGRGLELEPEAEDFLGLGKRVEAASAAAREKLEQRERQEAERRRPVECLVNAVLHRGVRVGPSLYASGRVSHRPLLDSEPGRANPLEAQMHWPVMVLYPEVGQMDYLEQVAEGAAFGDLLATMFDPAYAPAPPAWDPERRYRPDNISLFLQVEACDALPREALLEWYLGDSVPEGMADQDAGPLPEGYWAKHPRFARVPLDCCLLEALQTPGYVVPGTPAFHAVVQGTSMERRFLSGEYST